MATALTCGDKVLDLSLPCVMGILNVTPDSFSDGGLFVSTDENSLNELLIDKAVSHAKAMVDSGAAIIDIGGESTRPGAEPVAVEEERQRVLPVIEVLKHKVPNCLISVDTSKPELMKDAIDAGAHIINDVNALRAPGAVDAIAKSNVAVCLMHMKGEPRTMQKDPSYDNVVNDVADFLKQRIDVCKQAGIGADRIIIDPGFGFGKTLTHNLQLLKHLIKFKELGVAIMVGVSRKSMIGAVLDRSVDQRLSGSIALAALSAWLGADILRVHDVEESVDALKVVHAVQSVKNSH